MERTGNTMPMTTQDYVKKALLDSQERVRDYMNYSEQVDDAKLKKHFKEFAETEGKQAHILKQFLS